MIANDSRSSRAIFVWATCFLVFSALMAGLLGVTPARAAVLQPGFDQVQLGSVAGASTRAWGMAIADFTGDDINDIIAGNTAGDVTLLRGSGLGTYTPAAAVVVNGPFHDAYGITAGDFNGDGNTDFAMGKTVEGANDGCVFFYRGRGDGTFESTGALGAQIGKLIGDAGTNVTALASADVDRDGDIDVVANDIAVGTTDPANIVLFENTGIDASGTPLWAAGRVIVSKLDIAIDPALPPYYPPASGTLAGYGLALGDVDGANGPDLLFTDRAGYIYIYKNNGSASFTPFRFDTITSGTRPYSFAWMGFESLGIAAGDLNGDGRCDFAVGQCYTGATTEGKVAVFLNGGMSGDAPTFTAAGNVGGSGTDARGMAIGQLDQSNNGYADIAFGNYEGKVFGLFADILDSDGDGIVDRFDNLPGIANFPTIDLNCDGGLNAADQIELDGDGIGSVWDDATGQLVGDPDADGDLVLNEFDNLPLVANPAQVDLDGDLVGEVLAPWPLCQVGDVLDDRDPDGDGVPNGPFDATLVDRYKAAKQKLMTGDTPLILRIDALGRWWQAEFTQTLADSIVLDASTFATEYPKIWDGTYGSGATPPVGLEGGKELPVSVMLIPKLLWTDPEVVKWTNDRLPRTGFELGQHGTYHWAIQPPGLPSSEMNGFDPLEMYVFMRVGQDTMTGDYDRPGNDYLSAAEGVSPELSWVGASNPLISFAPPYDEFDRSGAYATAQLGYAAFSSDVWVEGLERTLMPDNTDAFDEFGALHAAARFMPWGTSAGSYATYITNNLAAGQTNVILIEEVNFSGKDAAGDVNNTIDAEKWANFQTMLDVIKNYPGGVPMTLGEYAMARAYDNAPLIANSDQADTNHNGIGDVADAPQIVDDFYLTTVGTMLTVDAATGVLANDVEPDGQAMSATVVAAPSHGSVELLTSGAFVYMPSTGFTGFDSFTYEASDGQFTSPRQATVNIGIGSADDAPVLTVAPQAQTLQYSDQISDITVQALAFGSASLDLTCSGLPGDLSVTSDVPTDWGVGISRTQTVGGTVSQPAGSYTIDCSATDDSARTTLASATIDVLVEDVLIGFDAGNPHSIAVAAGASTPPFSLGVTLSEPADDSPGDISLAHTSVSLVRSESGASFSGIVSGPDAEGRLSAAFGAVPAGTYRVDVVVDGGYYAGRAWDYLAVRAPLGTGASAAEGMGWLAWPANGDKTSFAFTGRLGASKVPATGGVFVIREGAGGSFAALSGTVLRSVSIGSGGSKTSKYSWITMIGSGSYLESGWTAPSACTYKLYAEDRSGGSDEFWIAVYDESNRQIANLSMSAPPAQGSAAIGGGSVSVIKK